MPKSRTDQVVPEDFEEALNQERERAVAGRSKETGRKKVPSTFLVAPNVRDRIRSWAARLQITQGEYLAMVQSLFEDLYESGQVEVEFEQKITPNWKARAKLRRKGPGGSSASSD